MAIVETRELKKTYRQGRLEVHALQGVDLKIEPGEFTVLMGPSGCGKTTLLNIIGTLDAPTSGRVILEGSDVSQLSKTERAALRLSRLGFVFQAYNLLPVLSAYENTEFVLLMRGVPTEERRASVMKILDEVGLSGMEDRRPNELSGGQQQRVAVARAIVGEPALILADEPTANLDSRTAGELISTMRRLNEEHGLTFLFATHDPDVMAQARRIIRLVDGKIAEDKRQ